MTTIVVTGGGSGGHITPILAVAAELKRLDPAVWVVYIGQRGDKLADIPAADPNIDAVYSVRAGKFRRYHGAGWRQLFDLPTVLKNLRDAVYVVLGTAQSYRLIGRLKPDIIFTRGGFVSVPVALAGRWQGVPYITHDSDALPSLANRIIASGARCHAVALPIDTYPYPAEKTVMTGIPLSAKVVLVTSAINAEYRKTMGLLDDDQVVLITGGGNGARALNRVVVSDAPNLLASHPKLVLLHIAGRSEVASVEQAYQASLSEAQLKRVRVLGFVTDFYRYSAVADVVVARGGATNLAEFAVQGKACVIVPSPQLIWNVKNTESLSQRGAVVAVLEVEAQNGSLGVNIAKLLDNPSYRSKLAATLASLGRPAAAKTLAMLLLEQVATQNVSQKSS